MELHFDKKAINCLRRNVWEVQNQEQTLEVRLPDGYPDIGTILASWGQCIMRSKEWRGDGMTVSGGVMAWVMYAPADGTEPRCVEGWLPVQLKWNFPDSKREGSIRTSWLLQGCDARTLSARKMMVRANVGVLGEALEPWETDISTPEQLPEDIQLLRRTYPVMMPKEAGEKSFLIDEELTLPGGEPAPEQLIRFELIPRITEQKVLGGKAVFRGDVLMHLLYRGVDGQLHSMDLETSFSQLSDLDRDYDKDATVHVMMALSSLEPELMEGRLRLKCGLVAQYLIYDRCMLEVAEDAYSLNRSVDVRMQEVRLPMMLDRCRETIRCETMIPEEAGRIVDVSVCREHPMIRRAGELTELESGCVFQVLYYDGNGELKSSSARCSGVWELPAGENAEVLGMLQNLSQPQVSGGAGQINLRTSMDAEAMTTTRQGIPMVTELELGEPIRSDPTRPSLILRRAGSGSLWDIAKESGSTVDAIRAANRLTDEPLDDRLLLIPVS